MTTQILNSTAFLTFIDGDQIKDIQILIHDRQTYNALPGKLERRGIKTLSSWPIFVTAVLADDQTASQGGQL